MSEDTLAMTTESESSSFLGLSPNLWRLALVLAIGQLSIGLWKWQYSIFLETLIDPWQMGLTFSAGHGAAPQRCNGSVQWITPLAVQPVFMAARMSPVVLQTAPG